jgi:predicted transcriptional regulator
LSASLVANVTVSVPEELKKRMEHMKAVNWSEVAREAFEEMVRREKMARASETIDRLRSEAGRGKWSGAREIRKWRDKNRN